MVRLSDVDPAQRVHLENLDCPDMAPSTMQAARPMQQCRVALISSAGLMLRDEPNVAGNAADYRMIPSGAGDTDVLLNHVSVNFDRSGFIEDLNCVLPRDRLAELETSGIIASASEQHYSLMGATAPELMKDSVDKLIDELLDNNINTVCLLPV